jgi:surface carbohydrate biosynthesis protein
MFSLLSIKKIKRLTSVPSRKSDVLIIDDCGIEMIAKCIPVEFSVSILRNREGVPCIYKPIFLLLLLKRITQFGLTNKALISAIVDVVQPEVIISFIDTNPIMGELSLIFQEKLVISIQNGMRMAPSEFLEKVHNFSFPYYFSFGEYEKHMIEKYKIKSRGVNGVGSLKLGIFLSKHTVGFKKNSNICLISQYLKPPVTELIDDYIVKLNVIYSNLIMWNNNCKEQRKIIVAMRNNKDDKEAYFFTNNIDAKNVELINNVNFSSYKHGINSQIVVTMDSTLGFELFGLGCKVLFCAAIVGDEFPHKKNIDIILSKIPQFILLKSCKQEEFNSKINALINMDNEEYLSLTKAAREYYMKCEKKYPHEVVSEFIADFMQKETLTIGSNV